MVRIWSSGFWSRPQGAGPSGVTTRDVASGMAGAAVLVIAGLAMGFGAEHVLRASRLAARPIVTPSIYIEAVLAPDKIHPVRAVAAPAAATAGGGGRP
jgi:hypothetical protein